MLSLINIATAFGHSASIIRELNRNWITIITIYKRNSHSKDSHGRRCVEYSWPRAGCLGLYRRYFLEE